MFAADDFTRFHTFLRAAVGQRHEVLRGPMRSERYSAPGAASVDVASGSRVWPAVLGPSLHYPSRPAEISSVAKQHSARS